MNELPSRSVAWGVTCQQADGLVTRIVLIALDRVQPEPNSPSGIILAAPG